MYTYAMNSRHSCIAKHFLQIGESRLPPQVSVVQPLTYLPDMISASRRETAGLAPLLEHYPD